MMDLACACQAKSTLSYGQIIHFTVAVPVGNTTSAPLAMFALTDLLVE